jgi:tagatose-1,6-bisphosphate aldolase non-catalytic subunit AgaZ/GatZ
VEAAANVTTEVPLPGAGTADFENVAVTPVGSPLTLRLTAELKLP